MLYSNVKYAHNASRINHLITHSVWSVPHHDVVLSPEVLLYTLFVSSSLGRRQCNVCPVRLRSSLGRRQCYVCTVRQRVLIVEVAHELRDVWRVQKRAAIHHNLPRAGEKESSSEAHESF